jgi:hypothetical protein
MERLYDQYERETFRTQMSMECPNCKVHAALGLVDERQLWPQVSANLAPPFDAYVTEQVWKCLHCDRTATYLLVFPPSEEQRRDPTERRMTWPDVPPRDLSEHTPAAARSLFEEGARCEALGALRAAAGLYRAVVEEVCRDLGQSEGPLAARIEKLRERGVEADVVRDLHEARVTGNWSLHDGLEFTAAEIADIADLIVAATHDLYEEPARRRDMRASRAARRVAAADPTIPPA